MELSASCSSPEPRPYSAVGRALSSDFETSTQHTASATAQMAITKAICTNSAHNYFCQHPHALSVKMAAQEPSGNPQKHAFAPGPTRRSLCRPCAKVFESCDISINELSYTALVSHIQLRPGTGPLSPHLKV